jgi:hypothetical protein
MVFSPAARGLSAEGRIVPTIRLILSKCFFYDKNPFLRNRFFLTGFPDKTVLRDTSTGFSGSGC